MEPSPVAGMIEPPAECFVGVDMGTTNTRAWLVAGDRVAGRVRASVGVRNAAVAGTSAALRSSLGEIISKLVEAGRREEALEPSFVVAAGMITSALGLAEVPHVAAPAGVGELSRGVQRHRFREIEGLDVYLIPGVRSGGERLARREIDSADVMRGEETLCVGLLDGGELRPGGVLLNLGSHWKAIRIDAEGRIAASVTSLAGELLHAAQTRTVLAGSVPAGPPAGLDESWVRAGIEQARRSGLARALFCVRLLEQRTPSEAGERLAFLVGAFVGAELDALPWLQDSGAPVLITGGEAITEAFASALADRGVSARVVAPAQVEAAMVRGLGAVVGRRVKSEE